MAARKQRKRSGLPQPDEHRPHPATNPRHHPTASPTSWLQPFPHQPGDLLANRQIAPVQRQAAFSAIAQQHGNQHAARLAAHLTQPAPTTRPAAAHLIQRQPELIAEGHLDDLGRDVFLHNTAHFEVDGTLLDERSDIGELHSFTQGTLTALAGTTGRFAISGHLELSSTGLRPTRRNHSQVIRERLTQSFDIFWRYRITAAGKVTIEPSPYHIRFDAPSKNPSSGFGGATGIGLLSAAQLNPVTKGDTVTISPTILLPATHFDGLDKRQLVRQLRIIGLPAGR